MIMLTNNHDSTPTTSLLPILWAALEKIGNKQLDANQLAEDSSHTIHLNVNGFVNGQAVQQTIDSVLEVGARHEKSSSVNPQIGELIAWILSKLNAATRERILADLPAEFAETGSMPESDKTLVTQAKQMLKQLRTVKTVVARGPIRCQFSVVEADLAQACDSRCQGKCRCQRC